MVSLGEVARPGYSGALRAHRDPEFADGLTNKGFPAHLVQHLSAWCRTTATACSPATTTSSRRSAGQDPITVEDYAQAHREAFSTRRPLRHPRPGERVMIDTIGIIGSGDVARAIAKHALTAGYSVLLSNSRGPASLAETVAALGQRARAVPVTEAVDADLVIVAVPFVKVPELHRGGAGLDGAARRRRDQPVRPITNPTYSRRSSTSARKPAANGSPGTFQVQPMIKAFNTMYAGYIAADPRHDEGRQIVFYATDDTSARADVRPLRRPISVSPRCRWAVCTTAVGSCSSTVRSVPCMPFGRADMVDDFLWGVATGAHQTEGNKCRLGLVGVRARAPAPSSRSPPGDAVDAFHRWPRTWTWLQAPGLPTSGSASNGPASNPSRDTSRAPKSTTTAAWSRAREKSGLRPFVTLHHFTVPLVVQLVWGLASLRRARDRSSATSRRSNRFSPTASSTSGRSTNRTSSTCCQRRKRGMAATVHRGLPVPDPGSRTP